MNDAAFRQLRSSRASYEIHSSLGRGGMAEVHLGKQLGAFGFERLVAIKRLHPQLAADPQFVVMMIDEARLAANIRHPNVVATLDLVAAGAETCVVFDYVHGESLSALLRATLARDESVPLPIVLALMADILAGLGAAHSATDASGAPLNIIHRDVSPQNVLVGTDGVARLIDFGVARALGRMQTTRDGSLKGKMGYMSPEQLGGKNLDARTDLFAAGIVLWELLAMERLFVGDSDAEILHGIVSRDVPAPSTKVGGISPELDALVLKALARNPEDRFRSAAEMLGALERCSPAASRRELGEWVTSRAAETLERRLSLLKDVPKASGPLAEDVVTVTGRVEPIPLRGTPSRWRWAGPLIVVLLGALGWGAYRLRGVHSAPPSAAPPPTTQASPPPAPTATATPAPPPTQATQATANPPEPDAHGTSRPHRHSVATKANCHPPYFMTADGHKHFKPDCL